MSNKHIKPQVKARDMHSAWSQAAPEASFASTSLSQYAEAIQVVTDMDTEVRNLDNLLITKKADRLDAEAVLHTLNKQIVNSVKSTPGFGEDASILKSFGYVRSSERKSGLHRVPAAPVVAASPAPVIIPSGIVPAGINEMGGNNAA